MRDGGPRWGVVSVGAAALVAAGAVGFATVRKGYESVCGSVFDRQGPVGWCADVHLRLTVAVGALAIVGLVLVVVGLAGRLRGGRLLVAAVLVAGMWALGIAGVNRLVRYDVCGSVTTPFEWPDNPSPDGRTRPEGCDGVLPGRRAQAVGLWAGAVTLVVVVRGAPDRRATGPRAHPVGGSPAR